jgi:type II secretory pathway pseudopilin PulG
MTLEKISDPFRSNSAFTLIETLIVTGILAALVTTAFVQLAGFKARHSFDLDSETIVGALSNAQSKSIQQENGQSWGVRFANVNGQAQYQIFSGTTYNSANVVTADSLSAVSSFTNPPATSTLDVVFNKLTGVPSTGSAAVVVLKQSGSSNLYSIFVSSAGKISKILETGLVGYWPMDEGSGSAAYDASGNGDTGTLVNNPAWQINCQINGCLNFNQTGSYVWMADASSNHLTSAFTFSAWLYPTAYSAENIIFNKENTYEWAIDTTQNVRWAINNSIPGWSWINTGLSAPLSQWTNFVITYDGSSVITYKNGVSGNTYSGAFGSLVPNGSRLLIAARGDISPGSFFNGELDDVRIYNRALSATEVQNLYNSY